jgi:hypothetical protein
VVKTKTSTVALCALLAGLAAIAPGESAVLPPEGATTYVAEVVGRVIDVSPNGKGAVETLVEVAGTTQNTRGQSIFDQMKARCLISFTSDGAKSSAVGACTETDGDGDILFTSFDGQAGKLLGGTGKYAGLTGSAVFSLTPEPVSAAGKIAYSVKHEVTWALKSAVAFPRVGKSAPSVNPITAP